MNISPRNLSRWHLLANDPNAGGAPLWSKDLGKVEGYAKVVLDGDEVSGGKRLDSLTNGRFVRIDRLDPGFITLQEVQVWTPKGSSLT